MPDLNFAIESASVIPQSLSPQLAFQLRIVNMLGDEPIHTIVLRCQIQIEAARRRYHTDEQEKLHDLFGEPARWSQTLRSMLWTNTNVVVPAFNGATTIDLPVPCSFDFNIAVTKYLYGLVDGEVPLCLFFNGTIFYQGDQGILQVAQISWQKEAYYRLPVRIWQEMMNSYYPNSAWLCSRRGR